MDRTGFTTPIVGTASVKVDTDANGNIIAGTTPATAASSKRISINNITADLTEGTADNIHTVFNAFIVTLCGADSTVIDESETTFTVKWAI